MEIKNNQNELKIIDKSLYNLTLLSCCLVGMFGMHRIINKKYVSGTVMCVAYIIQIVCYNLAWYLQMNFPSNINNDSSFFWILLLMFSIFIFVILSIFLIIDTAMIIFGKFNVGNSGKVLCSGTQFFKVWSNYVFLTCIVLVVIKLYLLYNMVVSIV